MKKILFSLALIGTFAAMSAKGDSYIYWMADVTQSGGDNATIYDRGGFTYANLIAKDTDNHVMADLGWAAPVDGSFKTAARLPSESLAGYAVTDYQNWTYYVELYNGNWNLGTSEGMSWEALVNANAFYKSTFTGGTGTAAFTSFTYNAPEPTSGLLMLIGFCGLALKRKRV